MYIITIPFLRYDLTISHPTGAASKATATKTWEQPPVGASDTIGPSQEESQAESESRGALLEG
jgi:hypothetical protein